MGESKHYFVFCKYVWQEVNTMFLTYILEKVSTIVVYMYIGESKLRLTCCEDAEQKR